MISYASLEAIYRVWTSGEVHGVALDWMQESLEESIALSCGLDIVISQVSTFYARSCEFFTCAYGIVIQGNFSHHGTKTGSMM